MGASSSATPRIVILDDSNCCPKRARAGRDGNRAPSGWAGRSRRGVGALAMVTRAAPPTS